MNDEAMAMKAIEQMLTAERRRVSVTRRIRRRIVTAYRRLGWVMAGRPRVVLRAGGRIEGATFHRIGLMAWDHPLAPSTVIKESFFEDCPDSAMRVIGCRKGKK